MMEASPTTEVARIPTLSERLAEAAKTSTSSTTPEDNSIGRSITSNDNRRSKTPPRANLSPILDNRYEFRVTIPPSDTERALQTLVATLGKILTKLWETDNRVRILPWANKSVLRPIKTISDIPESPALIVQYFPRLYPNSRGGTKYSSIRISSSLSPTELRAGIQWYLIDNRHGLYLAQLQKEKVKEALWLLYSTELTDTSTLKHAIEAKLRETTGKNIEIGLRWRTIQLDKPGRIPDDEAVKAVHIEVEEDQFYEAKAALQDIYSSDATEFPLHLKLRAVPLLKHAENRFAQQQIFRLMGRQASFNDEEFGKRKIHCWEIKELDFPAATSGFSLRDRIMSIMRHDDPELRLFHSVDRLRGYNRQSTVVFTCMPHVESEARNMVSSLITYLQEKHGSEVTEFFTKDAQVRAMDSYWDNENQCVRNKDDEYISKLLEDNFDSEYTLPPVKKRNQKNDQSNAVPERPTPRSQPNTNSRFHTLQRNTFGEEEDSVGSFRRYENQDTATATTDNSDPTVASLTSRLTALEELLRSHYISVPNTISPSSNSTTEGMVNAGGPFGERAPGGNG